MAQLTYSTKPTVGELGLIYDVGYDNVVMSASAAAAVYVGSLSKFGPDSPLPPGSGQVQELADGAASLGRLCIPIFDSNRMPFAAGLGSKAQYVAQDEVPVLTRGRIWVYTEVATAITDPVFVRVLAASTNVKGQFTNAATTNFIAVPNASWVTATAAAGLIVLELR